MTEPIRTCAAHGPYSSTDGRCPVCDARGALLLSGERRRRLSKFVSGALRHFPEDVGLELDAHGWTDYEALAGAVEAKYDWAEPCHVAAVIATDPKGRFERTDASGTDDGAGNGLVRASYGHSVDVDLGPTDEPVPDELYHGTAPATLASIREDGLRPMSRQQVHLSGSREAARRVGQRHANDPVVLVVDATAMLADDQRITKRGRETYTTDAVAPEYIDFPAMES
ncbi:phosphotransferase KptA/Tpt1 [Haloterrigena turkmenica DSM 5511]|uniref:Probable RNA 2'-phosphotransferase n=1 Tax=Haloterrigena turkmenica (strain ATCC 51198 / DSM 5511 / JCM 9101 / NCIMB 13204 / VKM B-1734 / 4k) TaxID=543526 RepID=D2RVR1_HALTV|nr:RNA 2'-phosphotransferase [Haloterrigena turkmenica]ADB59425.1 phosphotransferase KptA/Tpt1 [Haloterrigena turkmenica DSM 5511]